MLHLWQVTRLCVRTDFLGGNYLFILISGSSFLKVQNIGRRIFKWSAQTDVIMGSTCNLLLIASRFDTKKEKIMFYFGGSHMEELHGGGIAEILVYARWVIYFSAHVNLFGMPIFHFYVLQCFHSLKLLFLFFWSMGLC